MKNLAILAAAVAMAIGPAHAQLPPAAYAGPLWDRVMGGFKCVGWSIDNPDNLTPHPIVLPQFVERAARMKGSLPEGMYVYWDAVAGKCVVGGAQAGPQL